MTLEELKAHCKSGDVLFSYSGNILSRAIWFISTLWTNTVHEKKVSHAFIYMGRGMIVEESLSGVVIVNIEEYRASSYQLQAYRYTGPKINAALLVDNCRMAAGVVQYSFVELLYILIKKVFRVKHVGKAEKNAQICSAFVLSQYRKIGVDLLPGIYGADVTPLELSRSKFLAPVPEK